MVGKKAVLMFVLLSLGLVAATFHPAQSKLSAKIDFSGFAEGDIVGSLSVGTGISGDPIEGFVSVFGLNPRIPGKNTAMIFDAKVFALLISQVFNDDVQGIGTSDVVLAAICYHDVFFIGQFCNDNIQGF